MDDDLRIRELISLGILDTPPERAFDDIAFLAGQICETPIALLSFIDHDRQWFKAKVGWNSANIPRSHSICAEALLRPGAFVIPDTLADPRYAKHPLVTDDPRIRFYAGAPILSPDGVPIGTVCVMDRISRILPASRREALLSLARQAQALLDLRMQAHTQSMLNRILQDGQALIQNLFDHCADSMAIAAINGQFVKVNQAFCSLTGYANDDLVMRSFQGITHPDHLEADLAGLKKLLAGEIPSYRTTKRYLHADGHPIWVNVGVSLIRDRDGTPITFFSVVRDMSGLLTEEQKAAFSRRS